MRKSTLLLASALCVVNFGFAQSEKVIAEVNLSGDFKPMEKQIQAPKQFNFVNVSNAIMKAPAALAAPVASEATDVEIDEFTAHWSAVEGAGGYYLQVGRALETTTNAVDVFQLYEDFRLATPGVVAEGNTGKLLFNEGQTMRDWTLYKGQSDTAAIEINKEGVLYSPFMDFSNTAEEGTTVIFFGFEGTPGDKLNLGIVYVENDQQYGGVLFENAVVEEDGTWAYGLKFNSNPTYEQFALFFEVPNTNQNSISLRKVYCYQTMAANQQWEMFFTGVETTATTQKIYTVEYDDGMTPGVTEEYYYAVLAYTKNAFGSVTDQSDFSNIIVVGEGTGVEDIFVSNEKIFVHDNLHVVLDAPQQVSIYNVAGALVGSYQGVEGENEFALPASGVYVVKAGNTIAKVVK